MYSSFERDILRYVKFMRFYKKYCAKNPISLKWNGSKMESVQTQKYIVLQLLLQWKSDVLHTHINEIERDALVRILFCNCVNNNIVGLFVIMNRLCTAMLKTINGSGNLKVQTIDSCACAVDHATNVVCVSSMYQWSQSDPECSIFFRPWTLEL